jgi:hypothetical protein
MRHAQGATGGVPGEEPERSRGDNAKTAIWFNGKAMTPQIVHVRRQQVARFVSPV